MNTPTSPEDGTRFVPDSLYNVFAYLCTGILFISVCILLFADLSLLLKGWKALEIAGQLVVVLFLLSAVYVYSEFISVISYHAIRKPVSRLVRFLNPKGASDFFFDHKDLLARFDVLEQFPDKQKGNYWTLIYAAKIIHPAIGNDMLERHARVKMSRMNALNSFIVFLMALYSRIFEPAILVNSMIRKPHVGSLVLFGSFIGTLMFAFEFYQRQCWFGDIVLKISASLSRVEKDEKAK
jgi:hypothetical protein